MAPLLLSSRRCPLAPSSSESGLSTHRSEMQFGDALGERRGMLVMLVTPAHGQTEQDA